MTAQFYSNKLHVKNINRIKEFNRLFSINSHKFKQKYSTCTDACVSPIIFFHDENNMLRIFFKKSINLM